jgi:hypothetical protein
MNDSLTIIFGLAIFFGAIHGLCSGDNNSQHSKNLFSFLFGE